MAKGAYHKSVSMFWALGVPAVIFAVLLYAYQSPGWVGSQVQRTFGPILAPLVKWFDRII